MLFGLREDLMKETWLNYGIDLFFEKFATFQLRRKKYRPLRPIEFQETFKDLHFFDINSIRENWSLRQI